MRDRVPTTAPAAGPRTRRFLPRLLTLVVAVAPFACAGRSAAPGSGPPPPPLELRGATVMLFPVPAPAPTQIDRELEFWLTDRAPQADWILADELRRVVERTPGWRLRLDALPPGIADIGGGNLRVRDPLFGDLRRLAAVTDAGYAVLPLSVAAVADTAASAVGGFATALQLTVALADARSGRVVWLGTVRGEGAPDSDARRAASVAEALARALLR